MVGVCLVAMFAITAVASATASAAQPEYQACTKLKANAITKKFAGNYTNSTCTEVNATKEGAYEIEAAKLPMSFAGKGKAATFYYYKPGGKIAWKVLCKKNLESAAIEETTSLEGTITFEECVATNQVTKAKSTCAGSIVVPFAGLLREQTVPASAGFGVSYLFLAPAYTCGSATFESVTAFPFVTGALTPTKAGELGVWTVNKATGVQTFEGWTEEGKPSTFAPPEAEVTEGATAQTLRFGLATTDPLTPKKGVIVR
jgi:hypothetical protein